MLIQRLKKILDWKSKSPHLCTSNPKLCLWHFIGLFWHAWNWFGFSNPTFLKSLDYLNLMHFCHISFSDVQCQDSNQFASNCPFWKWACTVPQHISFMQTNCKKSCGWCSGNWCPKLLYTVKLGNKERFDKEQIGVKELFTDYQPFYTINLLLDKELLPI